MINIKFYWIEFLELKNKVFKRNNVLNEISNWLVTEEANISELEELVIDFKLNK